VVGVEGLLAAEWRGGYSGVRGRKRLDLEKELTKREGEWLAGWRVMYSLETIDILGMR